MSEKDNGGPGVRVPLKNGGAAFVSACDADMVLSQEWRRGQNGYVYRVGGRSAGVPCLLHRIVVGASSGMDVHHVNGDKTDCRRENLQTLSQSEHQDHHKHLVAARNASSRKYSLTAECKMCQATFTKHPDHRGRQTCCSKRCACLAAVAARKEKRNVA